MIEKHNLLTGSVPRKLAVFALPLLLANMLQSFYNVVDMLVIGQIVGDVGLAAISNASKLCYIINSICIGMTMGGAVLIAQYKGADDAKGQAESFQMLALLSLVSSFLVTVVSLAIYRPLFQALNVRQMTYQDACDYMKTICCGTVFVFGYNAVCSVLKGLGDAKSPLCFVGIATIINVILDIILVGSFEMGTVGAAYATITAQGISFVISLLYLKRHKVFFSAAEHGKFTLQWDKLTAIIKSRSTHSNSDGSSQHSLSAGNRYAQSIWYICFRRIWRRLADQYLCWYALLGYWTGSNGDGWPVHGRKTNRASQKGGKNQFSDECCCNARCRNWRTVFAEPLICFW